MILKQLRISRHLSQEQLAIMSGLNVRTIQRIESGKNASVESLKCLSSALEVDVETLTKGEFMIDKSSDHWRDLPLALKCWFMFNFLQIRPIRQSAVRIERIAHFSGFLFCCLGLINEAALAGGLLMLASGYLFNFLKWQGDKYSIWYDNSEAN